MSKHASSGPRPRKRFGQHFLHDEATIQRIVDYFRPVRGQCVLEIGPGLGALTSALLPVLGSLDVVELDRDLIPRLEANCATLGTLHVHAADALKFDVQALRAERCPGARLRIVGNLPYNISTPLLFHLLAQIEAIEDMHFMLQREVVERLAAQPGSGSYGRLSVMVQLQCAVEKLFTVGPGAFRPPPQVDSAVVRLRPHPCAPVELVDEAALSRVVAEAFSHRRKTLRNALKNVLDEADIVGADIDPSQRPEQVTLEGFARLANAFARRSAP